MRFYHLSSLALLATLSLTSAMLSKANAENIRPWSTPGKAADTLRSSAEFFSQNLADYANMDELAKTKTQKQKDSVEAAATRFEEVRTEIKGTKKVILTENTFPLTTKTGVDWYKILIQKNVIWTSYSITTSERGKVKGTKSFGETKPETYDTIVYTGDDLIISDTLITRKVKNLLIESLPKPALDSTTTVQPEKEIIFNRRAQKKQ